MRNRRTTLALLVLPPELTELKSIEETREMYNYRTLRCPPLRPRHSLLEKYLNYPGQGYRRKGAAHS